MMNGMENIEPLGWCPATAGVWANKGLGVRGYVLIAVLDHLLIDLK